MNWNFNYASSQDESVDNPSMLNAALSYAAKGWPVFPCRDKKPLTKHGVKDATTNHFQIRRWWTDYPDAQIGCAMGPLSRHWALDVDPPYGAATLASLQAANSSLPITLKQTTGSGGEHYLFAYPTDAVIRNNAKTKLGPGLDVRGDGGYIILAPSCHESGNSYRWQNEDAQSVPAPEWLKDLVADRNQRTVWEASGAGYTGSTSAYGRKALQDELEKVASASEGVRNELLNQAAFALGQLVGGGEIARHEAEEGLVGAAHKVGLGESEARKTIESGMSAGGRSPRTSPEGSTGGAIGGTQKSVLEPALDDSWQPEVSTAPILSQDALPGIVGEFVELATRNSEADLAAVLATFLARFGAELISPYFMVGETRHSARLFVAIVGASSKARKGTSGAPVLKLFSLDSAFGYIPANSSPGPLSSGEGLVHAVRDENKTWEVDKKTKEGQWVITDPGVDDKRLFVLDEELASALQCTRREGNTLSTAMRCFWDTGSVDPLTKSNKIKTTNAHLSVVSHITRVELAKLLGVVQAFNGFGNRFLWIHAERRGLVPIPKPMQSEELSRIRAQIVGLLKSAAGINEVQMSPQATALWERAYPRLSQEYPGLAGCILNRGEAQVIRLSLIYALLSGQREITAENLKSGLAFWEYSRASAMMIFGGYESDPLAEKVLTILKLGPKSLTEIHGDLGRHTPGKTLKGILSQLVKDKRVVAEEVPTSGRKKFTFRLCEESEER